MAKIILITGPSGVGKGTIEKELFKDNNLNLEFSISATTRAKRDNEKDGEHYHFISKEEFEKLILENKFLEYSNHFGNYYGTLIEEVELRLKKGKNVLVEVETTGALNIINNLKQNNKIDMLISIFITPPSIEELRNRIIKRNSENEDDIEKRIQKAKKELEYKVYFQHIVENNDINKSVNSIKNIIKGVK